MKRSPNVIALRQYRDALHMASLQEVDADPVLFVMSRLIQLFLEFDLPVEVVGAIEINIDSSFFENKKFADEILYYFVQNCKKLYDMIYNHVWTGYEDHVDEAKKIAATIFGDFLAQGPCIEWGWDYDYEEDSDDDQ